MNASKFKRLLIQQEANFKPGIGGHLRVELNGKRTVLPMHSSYELGSNIIKTITKQLGLSDTQDI